MRKTLKMFSIFIITLILLLIITTYFVLRQPQFGRAPTGKRLEMMQKLPNYKDGQFQNLSPTPQLAEGYSMTRVIWDFLFLRPENTIPDRLVPTHKTNLKDIPAAEDVLVWMGHSSYFMQIGGKKYLVDPVLSGYASPFSFYVKAFDGSHIYAADDIPDIDFLIITHDHYDHLDHQTVSSLRSRVKHVICPWGVGEHLEYWGYAPDIITEKNWNESVEIGLNTYIHVTPARHFSGRTFKRNNTLWASYVLQTPDLKIFIGGDSGYDTHFKSIGQQFGPFDWAILENGQYDAKWKYIHALPSDMSDIVHDLRAGHLLTVHHGKFKLAMHAWDEPLKEVSRLAEENGIRLATPMIGEKMDLRHPHHNYAQWWNNQQQ